MGSELVGILIALIASATSIAVAVISQKARQRTKTQMNDLALALLEHLESDLDMHRATHDADVARFQRQIEDVKNIIKRP